MTKENILFLIVGLLGGLIIGFVFANSVNQTGAVPVASGMAQNSNMPAGHPTVPAGAGGMQPEVQAAIDKAKAEPEDFDAQLKAAEFYYQIQRFDGAIEFLKRANQLRPENREVIVHLGNANFDIENYEEAEKWYTSALAKKADDVDVRTDLGLTFIFRNKPDYDRAVQEFRRTLEINPNHPQALQNLTVAFTKKGDASKATETLARLEELDPASASVAQLRTEIQKISSK